VARPRKSGHQGRAGSMSKTPEPNQDVSPCPMCLRDGKHDASTHQTSTCPAWVDVSAVATADIKGWLAAAGLSIGASREV